MEKCCVIQKRRPQKKRTQVASWRPSFLVRCRPGSRYLLWFGPRSTMRTFAPLAADRSVSASEFDTAERPACKNGQLQPKLAYPHFRGGALQLTSTCCRYLACAARDAAQDAVMRCALPEMRMYGAERSWPQTPEMLDARLLLCLSVHPDAAVGSGFGSRLPSGTGYTMALHKPKRPPTP